jgi:Pentapeptide repeats (8 copies)
MDGASSALVRMWDVTTQQGEPGAANQLASNGSAHGSDHVAEKPGREPVVPPKGWPLWVWPPLAIALIAVAGYKLGIAGALTTAASAIAALFFVAGDILYSGQRRRAFAILAISLGVIIVTALLWQAKVPWVRPRFAMQTAAPGPFDLRGSTVTQAQAARLNLRGALLSGAVLDGLDLRGKQMEGVSAAGASFRHADLSFASLRGADLNGADFSYACLIGTDFTGATLDGADVNHAVLNIQGLPPSVVRKLTGVPISPPPYQLNC